MRYDETLLEIADIKAAVHHSGYQSADGSQSRQVSEGKPSRQRAAVPTPQAAPDAAPTPVAAVPQAAPAAPAAVPATPAGNGHEGHTAPDTQGTMPADMAHEMGHGGKDLPAMVRDMRNRFRICLFFTLLGAGCSALLRLPSSIRAGLSSSPLGAR